MSEANSRTILVVEDEADVASYLIALLTDNGYRVISAVDGKEGMEKAIAERPDLITLDIAMPEESGVRMYRNLHDDPATSGIPVIVITGISHDFKRFIETRRRVPPPAGYFDKPVEAGALLAKVSELLSARVQ
jgi:CheY-like chemotaxis protein